MSLLSINQTVLILEMYYVTYKVGTESV